MKKGKKINKKASTPEENVNKLFGDINYLEYKFKLLRKLLKSSDDSHNSSFDKLIIDKTKEILSQASKLKRVVNNYSKIN